MNARLDDIPLDPSRRRFLRGSAAGSAGLIIAFGVPLVGRRALAAAAPDAALPPPNAFLHIAPDDSVTVVLAHSEMGQGIWTSLPMLLAEELECDWGKVRAEHAPAAPVYASPMFHIQMTGGSTTTMSEFDRYREVGALARMQLVAAAARRFGVAPAACRVERGVVIAGEQRARFGELASAAAQLPLPAAPVALKPRQDWTLIGKPTPRLDTPAKITGRAAFGLDARPAGVRVALVARAPAFGAKLKHYDASAARKVPGVDAVVAVPTGVAVIGAHFWAARTGRDALKLDWDLGPGAHFDSTAELAQYRALARTPGNPAATRGEAARALAAAKSPIEAEYSVPYLAHATMEPLNCTVELGADHCRVTTGTQFQTGDQASAAHILGFKPEQVEIVTAFLGGGFGRRANPASDFVSEAVQVAKAARTAGHTAPVKVVWTREDDMHGGWYRPQFVHRMRAALGSDGLPAAFADRIVGQSIMAGTPFGAGMVKNGIDPVSVEGVVGSPYLEATPAYAVELHSPAAPVPVLWWRSVGNTHTAFAMESFIDELAHAAGRDPLEYRRALLGKAGARRHLAVLERAAERFGWTKPLPPGHAKGLAVHASFGSYVAQVAEVSLVDGKPRVHRVACAVDCGIAVNPETIRAQMEGAIVYGLTAALYGAITLKDGRVQQDNFDTYPPLRMDAMPRIEVAIVDSGEKPGGIGEPGTPPIAPAVANALFALTGKRLRDLPFKLA